MYGAREEAQVPLYNTAGKSACKGVFYGVITGRMLKVQCDLKEWSVLPLFPLVKDQSFVCKERLEVKECQLDIRLCILKRAKCTCDFSKGRLGVCDVLE
jgi:hypothetical protein